MARGKPVVLGDKSFRTRQEALAFFKIMLGRYKAGEVVVETDAVYLAELILRHPEAAEKIGLGVHHFEVMSADFGTKCFGIVRCNGTIIDFSYPTCVNARLDDV